MPIVDVDPPDELDLLLPLLEGLPSLLLPDADAPFPLLCCNCDADAAITGADDLSEAVADDVCGTDADEPDVLLPGLLLLATLVTLLLLLLPPCVDVDTVVASIVMVVAEDADADDGTDGGGNANCAAAAACCVACCRFWATAYAPKPWTIFPTLPNTSAISGSISTTVRGCANLAPFRSTQSTNATSMSCLMAMNASLFAASK